MIPTTLSTTIGNCLGNAAITAAYPPYAAAYKEHQLGGLLLEAYHPVGWSKFCLVMFTFSVLGNNIANLYSTGLSMQLLGPYFHAIPRALWSLIAVIVVAVLAIAGQEHLSTIISNFVALLGYWTVSFTFILLIEDKWFRRVDGYNLSAWNQPKKLPLGVAAVLALLTGYLGGGVTGMRWVLRVCDDASDMTDILIVKHTTSDRLQRSLGCAISSMSLSRVQSCANANRATVVMSASGSVACSPY